MMCLSSPLRRLVLVLPILGLVACNLQSPVDSTLDQLPSGTWGGNNAGLIVNDTVAHVHLGCTYGNFPAPVSLDPDGRFSIAGSYLLTAYPVERGPYMPAEFGGVLRGRLLTVSVAVYDTIDDQLTILGPSAVTLGKDPNLGPCPICAVPGNRSITGQAQRTGIVMKAWHLLLAPLRRTARHD